MNEQTLPGDLAPSRKAAVRARTGIFRNSNVHRWLRTFHRASALVFAIFMAVAGITGSLVALEMLLGPGAHGGRGAYSSTVHFTIMDLHTFFIFGKGPGLVVELLVTAALVFFSVSGVWFYAALFRQWLKLATKEIGGYAPSSAFRAANRFMAWVAVVLLAVVVILAVGSYIDYLVSRTAAMAAHLAHRPLPTPTFAAATKAFLSAKGEVIMIAISSAAIIYFCVVGLWYSGLVFAGWRLSKAKRAASPAEPAKAMRTIHRWLSVPFGLYLIVMAATGVASIPGLWTAGHLPFLSSPSHLQNLKREAMEARNRALRPELRVEPRARPARPPNLSMRDRSTMPLFGRLQQYLIEVHNGAVFGKGGQIFVLLTGLALALFSLSGIWMYVSMYFPRRESGRKALFWH